MTAALRAAAERVTQARSALSEAEADRDELIRQASRQGQSLRQIAKEAGVSFARVAQILNQGEK